MKSAIMEYCMLLAAGFLLPIHVKALEYKESGPQYWVDQAQATLQEAIASRRNEGVAKNIIFFLGDGMSIPTITAARIYRGQKDGKPGEETVFSFETFPDAALIKTYNVDMTVPDSAGTATAYLCGVKNNFGTIGVDERANRSICSTQNGTELTSILQWAQEAGKHTGFVTTASVTDASPAGLYAKTVERNWESDGDKPSGAEACKDIALQLIEDIPGRDIKVIMGGGRMSFINNTETDPLTGQNGHRLDGRNLINEWLSSKARFNSSFFNNTQGFNDWNTQETDYAMGLFDFGHMSYDNDRDLEPAGQPSLADMTMKAITMLSRSPNGYFIFVEGGRIDHAHHDGNAARALGDTLAFNEAIQAAANVTSESDTLIIVTADHAHTMSISGYPLRGHSILGKSQVSDVDNLPYTTLMYANGLVNNGSITQRPNLTEVDTEAVDYLQWAGVPMTSETHGGDDVAVFARGPMSYLFHGVQEQNYIPHALAYAACIGLNPTHCNTSLTT